MVIKGIYPAFFRHLSAFLGIYPPLHLALFSEICSPKRNPNEAFLFFTTSLIVALSVTLSVTLTLNITIKGVFKAWRINGICAAGSKLVLTVLSRRTAEAYYCI